MVRMKIPFILKIIVAAALLVFSLWVALNFNASNRESESCKKLKEIARSPEKIMYLKKWFNQKVSDREFLMHTGERLGRTSMLDDPEYFGKLNIDTEFLGINRSQASVVLNRHLEKTEDYMERGSIESVSIGEGRNRIIIILNNPDDLGIDGIDTIQKKVERIDKDVLVICR
jgi:hypothetical protein